MILPAGHPRRLWLRLGGRGSATPPSHTQSTEIDSDRSSNTRHQTPACAGQAGGRLYTKSLYWTEWLTHAGVKADRGWWQGRAERGQSGERRSAALISRLKMGVNKQNQRRRGKNKNTSAPNTRSGYKLKPITHKAFTQSERYRLRESAQTRSLTPDRNYTEPGKKTRGPVTN